MASNVITEKQDPEQEEHLAVCPICYDTIKLRELETLSCGHKFHKECIEPWLKQYNYRCPICRKECGKSKIHN